MVLLISFSHSFLMNSFSMFGRFYCRVIKRISLLHSNHAEFAFIGFIIYIKKRALVN